MIDRRLSFGYWLRRRRKALDLTQAELAARAGCVLTTIKKLETGARQPSRQLAGRLADALTLPDNDRTMLLDAAGLPPHSRLPSEPAQAAGATVRPSASSLPSALSAPKGPLIGREREFAALRSLLINTQTRLVTLIGPGGVGKTRLALHMVTDLHDMFVDGVWFVELAPLNDPALVPGAIARALGLEPGPEPMNILARVLRGQRTLIVLDNFEHLVARHRSSRNSWRSHLRSPSWPPAVHHYTSATSRNTLFRHWRSRRKNRHRRLIHTPPCSFSSSVPGPSNRTLCSQQSMERRWRRSAGALTACHWQLSWPRRASGCSHRRHCFDDLTGDWRCCVVGLAICPLASKR